MESCLDCQDYSFRFSSFEVAIVVLKYTISIGAYIDMHDVLYIASYRWDIYMHIFIDILRIWCKGAN